MRNAIIIGLVVLILLLVGAWVYLLVNGSPESMDELRGSFFGSSADAPAPSPDAGANDPDMNSDQGGNTSVAIGAVLAKLTDRRVAGATIAEIDGDRVVRYMEKGSGFVYDISLSTGMEIRVANVTIPGAVKAVWAPSGMRVIITTESEGDIAQVFFGNLTKSDIGEINFETEPIPGGATLANVAWNDVGDAVYYTRTNEQGGASGLLHNFKTNTTETVFTLPFREAVVLWDTTAAGQHYVYNRPAQSYTGYLYRLNGNDLTLIDGGSALTAMRVGTDHLVINRIVDGTPRGMILDIATGFAAVAGGQLAPEKCAGTDAALWCGSDSSSAALSYPIPWYQGMVSFADTIWRVDPVTGAGSAVVTPESLVRESIDVTDMLMGQSGQLIFRNKKDDALWLLNPPL